MKTISNNVRYSVLNSVEDSVLNSVQKYVRESAGFSPRIYPRNSAWISVERFILSVVRVSIQGFAVRPVYNYVYQKSKELTNENN